MAKKSVKYCVVDAFTDTAFKGNPAVVCMLVEKKEEEWLQSVASEFNLSETCYLTPIVDSELTNENPTFQLRWFTPVAEVNLCGHATLAAAQYLFAYGLVDSDKIEFRTLSGVLIAKKVPDDEIPSAMQNGVIQQGFSIELDFPVVPITEFNSAEVSAISKSLNGASVVEIHKTTKDDLVVLLTSGREVVEAQPQIDEVVKLPGTGMIITGAGPPGTEFDFCSRFFCPKLGINEDPVCGSAHCALAPYWRKKLGKHDFVAYAASPRSGVIKLHLDEENQRVFLRGKAAVVAEGSLLV